MQIKVLKYARLKATQAMPLVFSENGAGLFFQGTKLQGKLFVAAFGLDRESSSWPVHQSFIPFLDLALQTARAEDATPTNFEPGEVAVIQLPAGTGARTVVLSDERGELTRAVVENGKAQLHLPDLPGLYAMSYDDNPVSQKVFSVNPSPKESQLVFTASPEAVKVWQMARPTDATRPAAATARTTQISLADILQQRFWWWMLLGGLVMLLLENTLTEIKPARQS
jgi:hypothetical protein